jgi:hypothetical protein
MISQLMIYIPIHYSVVAPGLKKNKTQDDKNSTGSLDHGGK